jgi:hypothetical protein
LMVQQFKIDYCWHQFEMMKHEILKYVQRSRCQFYKSCRRPGLPDGIFASTKKNFLFILKLLVCAVHDQWVNFLVIWYIFGHLVYFSRLGML